MAKKSTETTAGQTVALTDDEAAVLEAYRQGKPMDIIEIYTEKHQPAPLPSDYTFPHDAAYARHITAIYDPDSDTAETQIAIDYRAKFSVSWHVASTAAARILAQARTPELDSDERKLIKAVRSGNIEFARSLLTKYAETVEFEPDEPNPDDLTVSQQLALAVVGNMAVRGSLTREHLRGSDLLVTLIDEIAEGISQGLPRVDHVAVDRMFAARR